MSRNLSIISFLTKRPKISNEGSTEINANSTPVPDFWECDSMDSDSNETSKIQSNAKSHANLQVIENVKKSTAKYVKVATVQTWKLVNKWEWIRHSCTDHSSLHVKEIWCDVCHEHGIKKYKTENVKKKSVLSHSKSAEHLDALSARAAKSTELPNTANVKSFKQADEDMLKKMDKLFHIAYTMAKSEVNFRFFEKFISCHTRISEGKSDLGVTYHNDKSCSVFTNFIGEVLFAGFCEKLKNARFFSLMIDESTDKSTTTKLVLFVRFVNEGEASTHFMKLTTSSSNILNAIDAEFTCNLSFPQWKEKIVSLGTDGAAVMTDRKSGFWAELQATCPWLVNIHCMAHRFELAVKSAFSKTYMDTLEMVIRLIHTFYSRSSKRMRALKEIATICEENVVKPQDSLDGTRWISHHYSACKGFVKHWQVITLHLEELTSYGSSEDKTSAKSILKHCMTYEFVHNLHFFTDVLGELSRLSLYIQNYDVSLYQVIHRFSSVKENLNDMKINAGLNLKKFTSNVKEQKNTGRFTYKDRVLGKKEKSFSLNKNAFIDDVLETIDIRFSPMTEEAIPKHSTIFEVGNWPTDLEELNKYGKAEISALIEHFEIPLQRSNVEVLDIVGEFSELKTDAFENHQSDIKRGSNKFWKRMFLEKYNSYKNILSMVEICSIFPLSTSCCEVGFSYLKRIQGDWRNSLKLETLNHLMTIEIEGPREESFIPRPAVLQWYDEKARNPERKPYGKRQLDEDDN